MDKPILYLQSILTTLKMSENNMFQGAFYHKNQSDVFDVAKYVSPLKYCVERQLKNKTFPLVQ